MPIHVTDLEPNRIGLQAVNTAIMLGLTDAAINGATLVEGAAPVTSLQAAVTAVPTHIDQEYAKVRINKGIKNSKTIGTYTDGPGNNVDAITTGAAGLRALHQAQDPIGIPNEKLTQQGGILAGE